eukprot:TRINITY_DN2761_c0_g2_i4.p1 TRINITY_DN2761_c0_g2~~TRINITY_DN2761_c0_g2_i4.p1  ORF type:complete len:414 (-),score=38.73 TRINITY_DN2761_c0_g2_i4:559-1800(-)
MRMDASVNIGAVCGPTFSALSSLCTLDAVRKPAFRSFASNFSSSKTTGKLNSLVWRLAKDHRTHPLTSCHAVTESSIHLLQHDVTHALHLTRQRFLEEISPCILDEEVSLAKVALLIAAEDEAFHLLNSEKDMIAVQREGYSSIVSSTPPSPLIGNGEGASISLGGISISDWLAKLDHLSHQVEAQLGSITTKPSTVSILKAMHTVLFKLKGFSRRSHLSTDSRAFYLHLVLNHGCAFAVMLGILFMELGKRLGLTMYGGVSGENFLIWPAMEGKQMAFEPREGCKAWFLADNNNETSLSQNSAQLVQGTRPKPTIQDKLKPASNRQILQIILQNLKRLHWSRACKGLTLTSPLHPVTSLPRGPPSLLRPQELRYRLVSYFSRAGVVPSCQLEVILNKHSGPAGLLWQRRKGY